MTLALLNVEREAAVWTVELSGGRQQSGRAYAVKSRWMLVTLRASSSAMHGLEADEYHAAFCPMGRSPCSHLMQEHGG
jgi:hypothetical protein